MALTPNSPLEGRTILVPRVLRGGWLRTLVREVVLSSGSDVPLELVAKSRKNFLALESRGEKYSSVWI